MSIKSTSLVRYGARIEAIVHLQKTTFSAL